MQQTLASRSHMPSTFKLETGSRLTRHHCMRQTLASRSHMPSTSNLGRVRSGKELIGLCPFHDDRNPSLNIDFVPQRT